MSLALILHYSGPDTPTYMAALSVSSQVKGNVSCFPHHTASLCWLLLPVLHCEQFSPVYVHSASLNRM
jgi:hypothetical protein